jgi:hypothetical protein
MSDIPVDQLFLNTVTSRLQYLKKKAEKAIDQVEDDADLFRVLDEKSNSIAIIMNHLAGNMKSRWTDFLTTDGEKPTRDRPGEFDRGLNVSRSELLEIWEDGWAFPFEAISQLTTEDLTKVVRIRDQEQLVLEAIISNLSHYSDHVGQIILLAKHFAFSSWKWLTRPPDDRYTPSR